MRITVLLDIDPVAASAATDPQTEQQVAAAALRDVASKIEGGVACDFVGQIVDDATSAWIGGFHVILQGS